MHLSNVWIPEAACLVSYLGVILNGAAEYLRLGFGEHSKALNHLLASIRIIFTRRLYLILCNLLRWSMDPRHLVVKLLIFHRAEKYRDTELTVGTILLFFWTSGLACERVFKGSTERGRKDTAEKRAEPSAFKSRVTACLFIPSRPRRDPRASLSLSSRRQGGALGASDMISSGPNIVCDRLLSVRARRTG